MVLEAIKDRGEVIGRRLHGREFLVEDETGQAVYATVVACLLVALKNGSRYSQAGLIFG